MPGDPGAAGWASIVFAPGVAALAAPEKTDFALIGRTELAEPPERKVVLALRALDGRGGKGPDRPFTFDDNDLLFAPFPGDVELIIAGNLPYVPTFPALHLAPGRDHQALALRTEHCFTNAFTCMIKAWDNAVSGTPVRMSLIKTLFQTVTDYYGNERVPGAGLLRLLPGLSHPYEV